MWQPTTESKLYHKARVTSNYSQSSPSWLYRFWYTVWVWVFDNAHVFVSVETTKEGGGNKNTHVFIGILLIKKHTEGVHKWETKNFAGS